MCIPTSFLTGLYDIPQMSPSCTSADLNKLYNHPRFLRTVPTDDAVAKAVCNYLDTLGLKFVAMLFANDEYGEAYKESMVSRCAARGVAVDAFPIEMQGDNMKSSIDTQMTKLKQLGLNVFFVVAWDHGLKYIMDKATQGGMNGKGKLWVFSDTVYKSMVVSFEEETKSKSDGALRVAAAGGTKYNPNFVNFTKDYHTFTDDDFKTHFPSWWQLPVGHFNNLKAATDPDVEGYGAYAYDAIASYGLAICQLTPKGPLPAEGFGTVLFDYARKNLTFAGLTGQVKFDEKNGNRADSSANYVLQNIVYSADKKSAVFTPKAFYNQKTGAWDREPGTEITFNENTNVPPVDAKRPPHDMNFISPGYVAVSYTLFIINMALATGFLVWTTVYRKSTIVDHSQPEFLAMICVGCMLSSSSILALLFAHDEGDGGVIYNFQRFEFNESVVNPSGIEGAEFAPRPFVVYTEGGAAAADQACMAVVWTYCVGFVLTFGALFAKIYRVSKIFSSTHSLAKINIRPRDMLIPIFVVMLIDVVILAAWQLTSPLVWKRTITDWDAKLLAPKKSFGECSPRDPASSGWLFLVPILGVHLVVLVLGNVMAYRARNVPTSYHEGRWIMISMFGNLEVMVVAFPILVIVASLPSASLFVRSAVIFLNDFGVLVFIFVPKVLTWGGVLKMDQVSATSETPKPNSETSDLSDLKTRASELMTFRRRGSNTHSVFGSNRIVPVSCQQTEQTEQTEDFGSASVEIVPTPKIEA